MIVDEVEYRQRISNGLRHAALKGARPDKKGREEKLRENGGRTR
jgi:hypothetical protein